MPRLPSRFAGAILCFAPLFLQRSWRHAEVLLIGAILVPGRRTVTSLLRIAGLGRKRRSSTTTACSTVPFGVRGPHPACCWVKPALRS